MNCDRGFFAKLRRSGTVPLRRIRGELAIEAYLHTANLYSVGWLRS